MRSIISILSGLLVLITNINSVNAESFSELGTLVATRVGFGPSRNTKIILSAKDGWTINTAYNLSIKLDDKILHLSDGTFKALEGNKTKEIFFTTKSTSAFGSAKLVFCNEKVCTQPLSINFNIIEK